MSEREREKESTCDSVSERKRKKGRVVCVHEKQRKEL